MRTNVLSYNLNILMKNLSGMMIAVSIPTFFAGVLGMSEFSSMVGFANWPVAYPVFVIVMGLLGLVVFVTIQKLEPLFH